MFQTIISFIKIDETVSVFLGMTNLKAMKNRPMILIGGWLSASERESISALPPSSSGHMFTIPLSSTGTNSMFPPIDPAPTPLFPHFNAGINPMFHTSPLQTAVSGVFARSVNLLHVHCAIMVSSSESSYE